MAWAEKPVMTGGEAAMLVCGWLIAGMVGLIIGRERFWEAALLAAGVTLLAICGNALVRARQARKR